MIKIQITEDAIQYLQKEGLFDRETAEELLQSLISLCYIGEGSPGIHPIDPILLSRVYEMSRSLGKVIEGLEALNRKGDIPEGGSPPSEYWPRLSIRDIEEIIEEIAKKLSDYDIVGYTVRGLPKGIEELGKWKVNLEEELILRRKELSRIREGIYRALLNLKDSEGAEDVSFAKASFLRATRILSETLKEGEGSVSQARDISREWGEYLTVKKWEKRLDRVAEIGAGIVLSVIFGWRRDPIPFDKETVIYKIKKDLQRALEEEQE